jgi:hypothetical protein
MGHSDPGGDEKIIVERATWQGKAIKGNDRLAGLHRWAILEMMQTELVFAGTACPHSISPSRARIMKRTLTALVGLFLLTSLLAGHAADEPLDTPYFPVKVGTRWTYKIGATTITVKVTKHEKIGDVNCAVLETSRDDQVVETVQIGIKPDGVYRIGVGAIKPDPPFRILKLPAKNGDSWDVDSKFGKDVLSGKFTLTEAEVTVPAGKYKTLLATGDGFKAPGPKDTFVKVVFKYWFAEKVGIVRQTFKFGDNPEVVAELEKFELP